MHFSEALIHAGLAVLSETTRCKSLTLLSLASSTADCAATTDAMFVDVTPSDIATGDVGTDQRVGYRPASVAEAWEQTGTDRNNDLVQFSKL